MRDKIYVEKTVTSYCSKYHIHCIYTVYTHLYLHVLYMPILTENTKCQARHFLERYLHIFSSFSFMSILTEITKYQDRLVVIYKYALSGLIIDENFFSP